MIRLFLVACVLLLAACGTTKPKAGEYQVRTEYVPVPCDAPVVQRPAWAVDALPIGAAIDLKMRALRADRKAALGHITVLEAALDACRSTPAPAGPEK